MDSVPSNIRMGAVGLLVDHQLTTLQEQSLEFDEPFLEPFDPELVQPTSVDLRLDINFRRLNWDGVEVAKWSEKKEAYRYRVPPLGFRLANTMEIVHLPSICAGRVEGKSTFGRKGLLTHSQAGFVDPGFKGQITLELFNATDQDIWLECGKPIVQLCVWALHSRPARTYGEAGNHYQDQRGPTPAAY